MVKTSVLIADDDPIIRLDLKQMLENMDYDVIAEAADGEEALRLARDLKPDVCLLDVRMPSIDGITVADKLTEEDIAPSVIVTAYSDKELVDRATEAGVFGYVVKPFKPVDLGPAIEVAKGRFEHNRQLRAEVSTLQDRIEVRKLVEKAKGVLMKDQGLSEADAYRRIQQQSMNLRKTMREMAEAILLASSVSTNDVS